MTHADSLALLEKCLTWDLPKIKCGGFRKPFDLLALAVCN